MWTASGWCVVFCWLKGLCLRDWRNASKVAVEEKQNTEAREREGWRQEEKGKEHKQTTEVASVAEFNNRPGFNSGERKHARPMNNKS